MKLATNSIRFNLGLIVAVIGLLGLGLAFATGNIYRNLTLENQRQTMSQMVELEVEDLLSELQKQAADLALSLQQSRKFRDLIKQGDKAELRRILDNQFHQYFVTAGILRLARLSVHDTFLSLITSSGEGMTSLPSSSIVCPELLTRARRRHGANRLQMLSEICLYEGRPYFALVAPTGGLKLSGYIVLIADPVHNLKSISTELGLPLQILLPNGEMVYTDETWPGLRTRPEQKIMLVRHNVKTQYNETALIIKVALDLAPLDEKLSEAVTTTSLIGASATALAIFLTLFSFNNTILRPLRTLTTQLRRVRSDKKYLGEQLVLTGDPELQELAEDFNAMSAKLGELYQTLESQAYSDHLTQLPNRALFHDRLQQATLMHSRSGECFALMIMDLDRFREINDSLGHHLGDRLLQQIGARLSKVLRRTDTLARLNDNTVARLGGDEFAVLLPGISSEQQAIVVAQKIQRAMAHSFEIEGHSLHTDLSIGITLFPDHGSEEQILMQRADIAMYQAKHNQQGFALYDVRNDNNSLSHLTMVSDLRRALDEGNLVLHYQPKVNIKERNVSAVEALIRWQHPEKGLISPDSFIPLAEHTGLIRPLTEWVLHQAISDCAALRKLGLPLQMCANISVRTLYDGALVEMVLALLKKHEMDGEWLNLELTESAIMTDSEKANKLLGQLAEQNVQLSIDDFGTGYSSLSHLKKLPIGEIKIDRSFVMDMRKNNNDAVIVRSTIDLAHNMGLEVTAEGVDSEESCGLLRELQCDMAQGFYIAKPMPYQELLIWLQTSPWASRIGPGRHIRLLKS